MPIRFSDDYNTTFFRFTLLHCRPFGLSLSAQQTLLPSAGFNHYTLNQVLSLSPFFVTFVYELLRVKEK
jgi:hypothetical protein